MPRKSTTSTKSPGEQRTLVDGRTLTADEDLVDLQVRTRVPQKWVAVDLECGHVWEGGADGAWSQASDIALAAVRKVLERREQDQRSA